MTITTKFTIGDKVYWLEKHTAELSTACTICNDTHEVNIKGTLFKCPNCARGTSKFRERWFAHTSLTTVGQVRVEVVLQAHHSCNFFDEDEIQGDGGVTKEQYMLSATGIGSGSLWGHQDLFLELAAAHAEAGRRNEALIQQEAGLPQ